MTQWDKWYYEPVTYEKHIFFLFMYKHFLFNDFCKSFTNKIKSIQIKTEYEY